MLANLRILRDSGVPYLVRIPVIPGFNDSLEDAAAFARLLKEMDIFKVQLLPFHRLGCHKYELLGLAYDYADTPSMQAEELEDYKKKTKILGTDILRLWCGNKDSKDFSLELLKLSRTTTSYPAF